MNIVLKGCADTLEALYVHQHISYNLSKSLFTSKTSASTQLWMQKKQYFISWDIVKHFWMLASKVVQKTIFKWQDMQAYHVIGS